MFALTRNKLIMRRPSWRSILYYGVPVTVAIGATSVALRAVGFDTGGVQGGSVASRVHSGIASITRSGVQKGSKIKQLFAEIGPMFFRNLFQHCMQLKSFFKPIQCNFISIVKVCFQFICHFINFDKYVQLLKHFTLIQSFVIVLFITVFYSYG